MIFAAIADIHGNHLALDAVLADIARLGITEIVNLGDCLSGPLDAGKTADRLMALGAATVRGNHDRYLTDSPADAMPVWEEHPFKQLSPAHLDWLRSLPFSLVWHEEIYCCHATPKDDNSYWLEKVSSDGHIFLRPLEEIEALAEGINQPLILCGHSHIPRMVRLRDGRLIVNPGSVGGPAYQDDAPYDHEVEAGHPFASYAVIEKSPFGWSVSFRNVPYNNLEASKIAERNGRPEWAAALATGWSR